MYMKVLKRKLAILLVLVFMFAQMPMQVLADVNFAPAEEIPGAVVTILGERPQVDRTIQLASSTEPGVVAVATVTVTRVGNNNSTGHFWVGSGIREYPSGITPPNQGRFIGSSLMNSPGILNATNLTRTFSVNLYADVATQTADSYVFGFEFSQTPGGSLNNAARTIFFWGTISIPREPQQSIEVTADNVLFREQRAPSLWFYRIGAGARDADEVTHGHYGPEVVIPFDEATNTFTVNASYMATQIAVDFARLLGVDRVVVGTAYCTAAPTVVVDLATSAHLDTAIDAGWAAGHVPAYLVVGTPAQGGTRAIEFEVNGLAFTVVINRAAPAPSALTIIINFPGVEDVRVNYSSNISGWQTVTLDADGSYTFGLPVEHFPTAGVLTVQAIRNGMSYSFPISISDVNYHMDEGIPLVLNVPLREITVSGINGPASVSIVQGGWVYFQVPVTGNNAANPFILFDNGVAYEVRVSAAGYHDLTGRMTTTSGNQNVWFGNLFSQHLVPAGVTNIRISNANWVDTTITHSTGMGGDVITLFNNFTPAVLHFTYGGNNFTVNFVLDGTNPFIGLKVVNFPGIYGAMIEYFSGGVWHTLEGTFDNSVTFWAPGATSVRASAGHAIRGMSYQRDGLGPWINVIDMPVTQLYVRGIPADGFNLGVVGANWVFMSVPALVNEHSFTVFNNRAYEVRLNRPGFHMLSRMTSEGDGYLYVDLSDYFFEIVIPPGFSGVRLQSNNWVMNNGTNLWQAGDTIHAFMDPLNYRAAIIDFHYCCYVAPLRRTINFILDGSNPLEDFVCCVPTVTEGDILFREQRSPSQWFYHIGAGARDADANPATYGHYGTASDVEFDPEYNIFTVNASYMATQIAVDFAMLLGVERVLSGTAYARDTSTEINLTVPPVNLYDTVDAGWAADHMPAYLVVGAPAQGEYRIIDFVVNGLAFTVVINRAEATKTCVPCSDCDQCPECDGHPVLSFRLYNNGPGGCPSTPHAGFNTIRLWTQLDGVNTRIPLSVANDMIAVDQDGYCALHYIVPVGRVWVAPGYVDGVWVPGRFIDYFTQINVNRPPTWHRITLTFDKCGVPVVVNLVNANFVAICPDCELNPCECCAVCGYFPCIWIATMPGDVNGDGYVTWDDYFALRAFLEGDAVKIHYGNANLTEPSIIGCRVPTWADLDALRNMLLGI